MNAHMISELPKTGLGEGPLWDGSRLIYVDVAEGLIHRHNFTDCTHEAISVGENVGFAVIGTEGSVIAGLGNGAIYRLHFGLNDRELLAPFRKPRLPSNALEVFLKSASHVSRQFSKPA